MFAYKLNQIEFERKPRIYSNDKKSYSIETILPDNEKIIIGYFNPSGKVMRIIFLH